MHNQTFTSIKRPIASPLCSFSLSFRRTPTIAIECPCYTLPMTELFQFEQVEGEGGMASPGSGMAGEICTVEYPSPYFSLAGTQGQKRLF